MIAEIPFLLKQSLPPVSDKRIYELITLGDIDGVIKHNVRLVYKIAHSFKMIDPNNIEDAVQEGCMGIVQSTERYQPDKGKFSTFAAFSIRNRIIDMIYKLPLVNAHPSTQRANKGKQLSPIRTQGDEELLLSKIASDVESESVLNESRLIAEEIQSALSSLDIDEEQLLKKRYGIDSNVITLRELSEEHSLSGERIRQKQVFAERSLKFEISSRLPDKNKKVAAHVIQDEINVGQPVPIEIIIKNRNK